MKLLKYCHSMFERDEVIARANSQGMIPQSCYLRLGEKSVWIVAADDGLEQQEVSLELKAKKEQLIKDRMISMLFESGSWDAIKHMRCRDLVESQQRFEEAIH